MDEICFRRFSLSSNYRRTIWGCVLESLRSRYEGSISTVRCAAFLEPIAGYIPFITILRDIHSNYTLLVVFLLQVWYVGTYTS